MAEDKIDEPCLKSITIDNTVLECERLSNHDGKCVSTFEIEQGPGPKHVWECVLSFSKLR